MTAPLMDNGANRRFRDWLTARRPIAPSSGRSCGVGLNAGG